MSNIVYFDTYDISNITKESAYIFDAELFAESLLINEKAIISSFQLENTLNYLCEVYGIKKTISLFNKKVLAIQWENISLNFKKIPQNGYDAIKFEVFDEVDMDFEKKLYEKLTKLNLEKIWRKRLQSVICNNSEIITVNDDIELDKMYMLLDKILNENKELYNILYSNKPYHLGLGLVKEKQCHINIENKIIFVENINNLPKEELKYIYSVIVGYFLPIVCRLFISQSIAQKLNCESIWGNKNIRAFQSRLLSNCIGDKISIHFRDLTYAFDCPNIALAVKNEAISGADILEYRKRMMYLREFLYNNKEYDKFELIRQYNIKIKEAYEKGKLSNYGLKPITFALGYLFPWYSIFDTFLKDAIIDSMKGNFNVPSIRIDEILKYPR